PPVAGPTTWRCLPSLLACAPGPPSPSPLSLHDALPLFARRRGIVRRAGRHHVARQVDVARRRRDRHPARDRARVGVRRGRDVLAARNRARLSPGHVAIPNAVVCLTTNTGPPVNANPGRT